ncbi:MAG: Signal recognition particle receptor FtsY [uncultured Nocardioidaceae bacterium]|uniref:Signal recognition particle receptor FtsY n=1 Tax=uncultured Nocardioidaceae bacterium TaxID=253824 RepID=A0A6J4MTQ4_9ACTN|nr:MAG: Signal recognition particle receptor FtsY [uncultured Nocardioidaceae bacterium]
MTDFADFVYVAIGLVVLGLLLLVGFVSTRFRRGPDEAPPAAPTAPTRDHDLEDDTDTRQDTTTDTIDDVVMPDEVAAGADTALPTLERPEPVAGRLQRLRARLARSQSALGRNLLVLLSRDRLDEATWEEIEDTLLAADVGVRPTQELVERLRDRVRVEAASGEAATALLRDELVQLVDPTLDRDLNTARVAGKPGVVMVVGVNGVGKTTTVGKLARVLVAEDKDVLLGAADTFRAAAADQLTTWGGRVGVPTVRGEEGADPASVAFEAVRAGIEQEVDTVIIDTAGRLHTKTGLMDELGKMKRVVEKQAQVDEVLLVIDATTGQNGLTQARIFAEVVDITGIVLTKLDGTAKGGIVIAVQRELGVPVKLVGLGEGGDDLAPFEAEPFVDALLDA